MNPNDGRHYSEDDLTGFLVEHRSKFVPKHTPRGREAIEVESLSFWYGPSHGWGTSSGGLDYSVRVFDSKVKAELALRRAGLKGRPGYRVVTVKTARLDAAKNRVEIAERAFALKEAELEAARLALFDLEGWVPS